MARVGIETWRLVVSPRVALVILLLLLMVTILAGLLPQVERGIERGSSQYDPWLAEAQSRHGPSVGLADSLGLLGIFSSRLFHFLLALVSGVALLRMLHLWAPSWVCPCPNPSKMVNLSLRSDSKDTWQRVSNALAVTGQHVVRRTDADGMEYAVARRTGPRGWVPGLFYLGLLTLLLASAVGQRWSWVGPSVELVPGETQSLGGSTGLDLRLDQIAFLPRDDGTMERFDSLVWLLRGSQVEKRAVVGLGKPVVYRGLALYELGFGPSVQISAQSAQGEVLPVKTMLGDPTARRTARLRFSGQHQEQLVAIPQADLVVRLLHYPSLPAQGIQGRALHVQIHRGSDGRLLAEEFLAKSGQVRAGDTIVRIGFEYCVRFRAEREPELFLAAFGGVLMLMGLIGFVLWPPRDVWLCVRSRRRGSVCQLVVAKRNSQAPWFRRLKSEIGEVTDG